MSVHCGFCQVRRLICNRELSFFSFCEILWFWHQNKVRTILFDEYFLCLVESSILPPVLQRNSYFFTNSTNSCVYQRPLPTKLTHLRTEMWIMTQLLLRKTHTNAGPIFIGVFYYAFLGKGKIFLPKIKYCRYIQYFLRHMVFWQLTLIKFHT